MTYESDNYARSVAEWEQWHTRSAKRLCGCFCSWDRECARQKLRASVVPIIPALDQVAPCPCPCHLREPAHQG